MDLRFSFITIGICLMINFSAAAQEHDAHLQRSANSGFSVPSVNKTDEKKSRTKKYLNIFSVVRFKNTICTGDSNLNGTCMTSNECDQKGGTGSGSCAAGYGVCCTFSMGCGSMSSANCTYFQSSAADVGACRLTICPCGNSICQLRLDFIAFVITGPSSATTSAVDILNGDATAAGLASSTSSRCLADTFSVTNPGGQGSDVLCGTNTGEHMYVDASPSCNELAFSLAAANSAANGVAMLATRSWTIKVTQYDCSYNNLAPQGCDQYHFGSTSGKIRTYNYNGGSGHHLADQDQNICVRRERTYCRICYSVQADIDFRLSGNNAAQGSIGGSKCCAYGGTGMLATVGGFDCVQIPGAVNTANVMLVKGNNVCGHRFVTMAASAGPKTICSQRTPFELRFLSDSYDSTLEAAFIATIQNDVGFELIYVLTTC